MIHFLLYLRLFICIIEPAFFLPCFEMEFSFGSQRWVPRDTIVGEQPLVERGSALGLHAPGFFDKVLHVKKCLLQSEAANKVLLG